MGLIYSARGGLSERNFLSHVQHVVLRFPDELATEISSVLFGQNDWLVEIIFLLHRL